MNSVFPTGLEKGEDMGRDSLHLGISPTKQAADRIFKTFISLADWHVDMHGGELFEDVDFNIEILPIGEPGRRENKGIGPYVQVGKNLGSTSGNDTSDA